jgi:hypothetical protein
MSASSCQAQLSWKGKFYVIEMFPEANNKKA